MKLKLENIFLFLAVLTDLTRTVSSIYQKCPQLKLVHGRIRYGWRGRSARFNCMRGFQLVGVKYVTCMNGKWDADVPICVKYGCPAPSTTHVNGQFIESYRGAVVRIVCNAGYTLIGSPIVYCNGMRWNETFPVCRVKNTNPALSCDFETPDLCGWSQDPMHDFDWKRENGAPTGEVLGGPFHDHTKGINGTGNYMSIERSSARMENETARLYSPVYPPEYSNSTCFRFWYYVHGAVTGFFKVFIKPEGVELFNLIPVFWISGEQGDTWKESFFIIEQLETPFQIVVEGVKGSGVVGDMAFDDVSLTSSDECKILEEMSTSTEFSTSVATDEDYNDIPTCKNRCNDDKTNSTVRGYDGRCSCHETCEREGTCCPDYSVFCPVYVSSSPTTAQTDMKLSSTISSSPATVPSEPQEKLPPIKSSPKPSPTPKPPPPIHFNNESNELPKGPFDKNPPRFEIPLEIPNEIPKRQPTTPRAVRNSTTARITTETKTEKLPVKKVEKIPETKTEKLPVKKVEKVPETKTEKLPEKKVEKIPEIKPEKKVETKTEKLPEKTAEKVPEIKTEKKVETKTEKVPEMKGEKLPEKKAGKPGKKVQPGNETPMKGAPKKEDSPKVEKGPEVKRTTVTAAINTTTAKPVKSSKSKFQKTFLEKPSSTNLGNEFKFIKKPKEAAGKEPPQAIKVDKKEEKTGGSLRGIVEIGSAGIAVLIIIIFGVIWYKRSEYKKTERENMVEDSDVRFLTSDEALDFTLARPADDDL